MGADLYIKCNGRYYRDSYNSSNLLWKLGLDYWTWFNKFLNEEGELSVAKAKKVLNEVESRKEKIKLDKEFEEYYQDFTSFLKEAIENKSKIDASI